MTAKPTSLQVQSENIPQALKDIPQWVCWRFKQKPGEDKPKKPPYQVNGLPAMVNDPSTWTTFDAVWSAYQGGGFSGIGFVMTDKDPFSGTDLDDCLNPDTGELDAVAAEIVSTLPTYCEVSPRGEGLRLFSLGRLPQGGGRKRGKIEMYDQGRFLTITGHRFNGHASINECTAELAKVHAKFLAKPAKPRKASTPPPVESASLDDARLLEKARTARNGAAFDALWNGDLSAHGDDASAADMALCNALAFWTDRDTTRIDRLFRQSGLMRDKWDESHYSDGRTYGQATIEKAIDDCKEGYGQRTKAGKFTPAPGSPWRQIDDEPEGDALLIRGNQRGLVKHNEAAEILFNVEFGRRLFYDPVALEWFEYQDKEGVFKHRPGLAVEQAVYRSIRQHCGWMGFDAAYVGGVTKCLLYEAVREARPASGKICFTNGVLDLATMTLLPHSPDHHFLHSLPYAWTPDASEPTVIIEWLHEAVGGNDDQVQLLRAYLNAVVVGRPDLQRFLELVGPGGSGKGTFTRLATALIGDSATHTTQLKQLEENRFESAKLFGKKLVIINDAEKWHGDVSMLKSITGEDSIRFEQKHKQAGESFTYGGMVIIAANQHTESTDYSSGIQRRRISVPFDHVIDASQRRDLAGEFQQHLPAFLKWVLDMPQASVTAYLRNTSAQVNSLREARLDALRATNPLVAWSLDNCAFDESFSTRIGEKVKLSINEVDGYKRTVTRTVYENEDDRLYPNYCRWCDNNGKMPVAKNSFSSSLVDVANNMLGKPFVKKHRTTEGRFIKGIKIKGSSCQPNVNLCQPNDNLMTTYPIDSADNVNLRQNLECLNVNTNSNPPPPVEITTYEDLGEKARENGVGCHDERNQSLRLTLGQHKVDIGQHGPTLVDIGQHEADTKQPSRVSIEPSRVVTAPPVKPAALICSWNNDDRLLTKCVKPEPNADRSGCASCGAVKEGVAA